jgi:cardiolipin synthase
MRNLAKLIFSRVVIVSLLILVQLGFLLLGLVAFREYWSWFSAFMRLVSVIAILVIISDKTDPSYKTAWIIPILALPIFGVMLYLIFGGNRLSLRIKRKMASLNQVLQSSLHPDEAVQAHLAEVCAPAARQTVYLESTSFGPVYENTETVYYPLGDVAFPRMLDELRKAERYIFLEYFIIGSGQMWDAVLEILKEKAAAGVDVRVIYDDFGCITVLPMHFRQELTALGIQCSVFNPYIPILSSRLNNRDHRKFMIIDGKVGFTGGINLADEYINQKMRFGHWKDNAIELRGDAVWSMTVMFLSMWNYINGNVDDVAQYRPEPFATEGGGFVQPYADSPLDFERVGENVYLSLIATAKRNVYIMTPYLIVDHAMVGALCTAARSGIDVRIITPHIPDKKYVHALSRAYYEVLVEAGVRIFEYTPGFIHSKVFCVDGVYATVGTVNLDYRSLYLHFEDGVWMYGADCIGAIEQDFAETFAVSEEITLERCRAAGRLTRLVRAVLRVFAPLM